MVVQEESTGVNALELLVDRATGNVFVEPGTNMMWNNKYGHHMGDFRDSTSTMPVSPQEAINAAQNWLNQNFPGAVAGEAKRFYGYYTFDFSRNSQVIGMLSVNGISREIWYHNWHGEFMGMMEYE